MPSQLSWTTLRQGNGAPTVPNPFRSYVATTSARFASRRASRPATGPRTGLPTTPCAPATSARAAAASTSSTVQSVTMPTKLGWKTWAGRPWKTQMTTTTCTVANCRPR
eukprot:3694318-Rhodomonas_salina.1